MGIAFHELKFIRLIASRGALGDVLTLARQNINMPVQQLTKEFGGRLQIEDLTYCEQLLTAKLGAKSVKSVDNSDYEGATYVADLNEEISLGRQFDTILDLGTTEHVFDAPAVFRNVIRHCRIGGRIVHSLPSNSECGHGFYQFSPELFFSLYSEANGFADTQVYIADMMNHRRWYRVAAPRDGHRVMANALSSTYILCVTTKVSDVAKLAVQQSDYVRAWDVGSIDRKIERPLIERMRTMLMGSRLAGPGNRLYRTWLARTGLTRFNPDLTSVVIASLVPPDPGP